MRYMMLIYTKEGDRDKMSPEEAQQIRDRHAAVMNESRERGMLVAVNGLGRTHTATTVRVDAGKILATDGPSPKRKSNSPATMCSIAKTSRKPSNGPHESRLLAAAHKARSRFANSSNFRTCPNRS